MRALWATAVTRCVPRAEDPPMTQAPQTYTFLSSVSNVGWLRCWLLPGAVGDFAGAVQLFFSPEKTGRDLDTPPQKGFWPNYAGVFLMVLTVLYVVAAMNPVRLL